MNRLSKRQTSWGTLAVLGYILSPLSWWNDLWVNIPIAYAVANLAQAMHPRFFLPAFVAAYWITNLFGLILMHVGIRGAATEKIPAFNRTGTLWWLAISLGYTAIMVALVHWGLLRPLAAYLPARQ
ncbi:MAG: hypothetical protein KKG09_08030 [Verrucomicrobia bacterium]|nr:hypothetical protein [Verrucomicrobiota bacterium]MBU4290190.1 hypothetical protein [Verrucomicrobiota bacterium]MBU4497936.1 hypothetical protein [Verrucomicrobiota bacterium]MCG2681702.1 hypothetical protein [Kiritimatiellia bacterium]